ncbi:MAG: hypothetical protein R3E54_17515 [Halioglobus sp.]
MSHSTLFQGQAPIAISYRPKTPDYLPVVVAAIRRFLGDWPIVLLTEARHLPPQAWLDAWRIATITDWAHSHNANKVLRLWEHQAVFAAHFERWIWWHDDMLLLREVHDPVAEFAVARVRQLPRPRPNKKLSNWHGWLWNTLDFFDSLSVPAPNPVCHIPRLIERRVLRSLPANWNRQRLLFEPTYLLWHWHQTGNAVQRVGEFRQCVFSGEMPPLAQFENSSSTILNWGRKIDHGSTQRAFAARYALGFDGVPG